MKTCIRLCSRPVRNSLNVFRSEKLHFFQYTFSKILADLQVIKYKRNFYGVLHPENSWANFDQVLYRTNESQLLRYAYIP
jgi:hypothetical protein